MIRLEITSVELNWTISNQKNIQGIFVERKSNDGDYKEIGYIDAPKKTSRPRRYSFVDSKLKAGKFNYRIKIVKHDGSFNFTNEFDVIVQALRR